MELKPRRSPVGEVPASHIQPSQIGWRLSRRAERELDGLRAEMGAVAYLSERDKLRAHLCAYFMGSGCGDGRSTSIFLLGATTSGGKRLKMRWTLPGRGKRRGCRIALTAWCPEKQVKIHAVWDKKEDPSHTEFLSAFTAE